MGIPVAIVGAAGRMGRRLIANIMESDDLTLSGALEIAGCPLLGQDAGTVAGCAPAGVAITDDLAKALAGAQAAIIFSTGSIREIAQAAAQQNCSMVIGTTALPKEEREELLRMTQNGAKIVLASNMSVGVNLLFKLAAEAAKILGEDYNVEIVEMHHNQKKDAPSGTAVSLAEAVCKATDRNYDADVVHGRNGMVGARTSREIGMHSLRGGDVVGDHTVIFATGGERVELTHKASSRDTFAKGALRAVRFLADAPAGMYDMQDVLGLK
ncbi:MAG: 4-hydroxy-tetrahydrodipicolinate reductase [Lentisphaeria bacterium]|nr:4-hydroxy-tetrahydrodipicolinate reductase [Lentisphaeria bacterium]